MDKGRRQQRKQERFPRSTGVEMKISENREVIFQGCRGVVEYREESVKLNTGRYLIAFEGRGLQIRWIDETEVVIKGFITSISFIV